MSQIGRSKKRTWLLEHSAANCFDLDPSQGHYASVGIVAQAAQDSSNTGLIAFLSAAGAIVITKAADFLLGRRKEKRDDHVAVKKLALEERVVEAKERVAEAKTMREQVNVLAEILDTSEGMRRRDNEECDRKLEHMDRKIEALRGK